MADKHERPKQFSIGIAGFGFVGNGMKHLFKDAVIYDPYKEDVPMKVDMDGLGQCDIVFLCLPTDMQEDGTADTSIVEKIISECSDKPVFVIKSTVPPGTTDSLSAKYPNKKIIFSPEFLSERTWQRDIENEVRVVLGGDYKDCRLVAQAFQSAYYPSTVSSQDLVYLYTTSKMAEMVKYTNNAFFAAKVSFFNQIFDICEALGINYDEMREIMLHERRITRSHTMITPMRGWGGYCLPKDLMALIKTAEINGYEPRLLKAIWNHNCSVRKEFEGQEVKMWRNGETINV